MGYKRIMDPKVEYLRMKDAIKIFGMGPDKIHDMAKECHALYKIDKCVLIKYDVFKEYLETYREG